MLNFLGSQELKKLYFLVKFMFEIKALGMLMRLMLSNKFGHFETKGPSKNKW